jgi:4'-phosphopantetheinyl transferase
MLLNELENECHVWYCYPEEITDEVILAEYRRILSTEERDKCKRFHFEKDQHSYLVSHAFLRKVLSAYCNVRADEWRFTCNRYGKPDISADIRCPPMKFNLSHTDGMSVVAVTLNADCGVDVENIKRRSRMLAVAERMFAEVEVSALRSCDDASMQARFFDYWTLREAYVKAIGTGIGGSSRDFYFTVDEQEQGDREARLHFVELEPKDKVSWRFTLLKPSLEHVIAVSVEHADPDDLHVESVPVISKKFFF